MTFIDIENKGYVFEMDGGGVIELRTSTPELWNDIRQKTIKKRVEYKKVDGELAGRRFEYDEVNEKLQSEMLWDYCIVNWENLFSDKEYKKPITCTKENKIILMNKSSKFINFVTEKLKELSELETEKEKSAEKN